VKTIALETIHSIRDELLKHPVYEYMNTSDRVRIFMKHHVFAVWDFMSLLKKLQQSLTCVDVPWVPRKNADYARFINEIVIGEETDENGEGGYASHFELYLQAMDEVGADTAPIKNYLKLVGNGYDPIESLNYGDIPKSAAEFVKHSLELAMNGQPHEVTSAFFFGREDLIPDMFTVLVKELEENGMSADRLKYYLNRHIELDGDEHGPLAEKLLLSLCEDDPVKLEQAEKVAQAALQARIRLWDGVLAEIREKGL
jgi:pyrroloquinoline quinone (PQQ) biosynthesis protein C